MGGELLPVEGVSLGAVSSEILHMSELITRRQVISYLVFFVGIVGPLVSIASPSGGGGGHIVEFVLHCWVVVAMWELVLSPSVWLQH